MASSLTVAERNALLDKLGTDAPYASVHTADPGGAGANEVTGGSPAYARKAITWAAASGGSKAFSNQPVFDIPTGTTCAYIGLWSAVSGGTYLGCMDNTDEVYAAQGTLTVTAGSWSL